MEGDYNKKFHFSGWHSNCLCYVTSILKTKDEFIKGLPSKNQINDIPRSAQRYQKTNKKKYWDWEKENFNAKNEPLASLGGPSKGIEEYKISIKSKDYKPQRKILKSAAKF
jgi:hypothetical protein